MKRALCFLALLPSLVALPARGEQRTLTLDQAVQLAWAHQPDILRAKANTAAADARADEQRSSLLPQVNSSAGYTRQTANFAAQPGSTPSGVVQVGGGTFDTVSYWRLGITASQLVWDFNATMDRYRSARLTAGSTQDSELTQASATLLAVRSTYFAAHANKALVTVAQDSVASNQAHLAQTEAFVKAGTRPEIDLAQNRADLANAQLQLVNAQNNYAQSKAQLNQAMGVEQSIDYEVADESLPALPEEDAGDERLVQAALETRPEMKSLTKQVGAQSELIRAARGTYWPSLGVSAGVTDVGSDLRSLTWNWNAQATLSWSIYQGGLTRAQVREAEANRAAADAQLLGERNQIRLEVVQARLAVTAGKASVETSATVLENQRTRLRLAEGRYQAGVGSIIELQDAQVAVTNAQGQVVQASFNLSVARAQLLKALGRLPSS